MTDKEIIKALECHANPDLATCEECPLLNRQDCAYKLSENALDLINRQQAEIKELEAEIDKQYEQAKADILGNMADGGASCHWCIDEHRKNAIKEFAERLKEHKHEGGCNYRKKPVYAVTEEKINNLVKEMVGEG